MRVVNSNMVPGSYSQIIARELGMQEQELPKLLLGTNLPVEIMQSSEQECITVKQQIRILENARLLSDRPELGLRLGRSLHPSSHGSMGYLVLSSPDLISALKSFCEYLPLRLPFSEVRISIGDVWLECTLKLRVEVRTDIKRIFHECFAMMMQSIVESVLGRDLQDISASIELEHSEPEYHSLYKEYLHAPVTFGSVTSKFRLPTDLAWESNISRHTDSYTNAQQICQRLLRELPGSRKSVTNQVRRLLLSSPPASMTINDVAQNMFISKRTLQLRLNREGNTYRKITEKLNSELAAHHLQDTNMTIQAIATLLGYNDAAAFRKAFHRWYGKSPKDYRYDTWGM